MNSFQELIESDVSLLKASNLCANAVVGYRTINDIIVVKSTTLWIGAMIVNKVCPLLGVFLETFVTELFEEIFIKFKNIYNVVGFFKLGSELR